MKHRMSIFVILGMVLYSSQGMTKNFEEKSSGLVFRGSYWQTESNGFEVTVSSHNFNESVDVGTYGGWLTFFSRLNDQMYLECSIGTIGQVRTQSEWFESEEVQVKGMIPLIFGVRYDLLPLRSPSAIQPYVAGGGGPYWQTNINVVDRWFAEEEVSVKSKMRPGLYLGGGVNFRAANWFMLNFDMKYHLVNFDFDQDFSGFEFGMGFGILWGSY